MKRKLRIKKKKVWIFVFIILIIILFIYCLNKDNEIKNSKNIKNNSLKSVNDFESMHIDDVKDYAKEKKLELSISYEYNDDIKKNKVISGTQDGNNLSVIVSLGEVPYDVYREKKVDELGKVPIMMYHGIVDTDTNKYTGGNVDKDGYNRTSKAFMKDLEFYYENGYRMIRLDDYVDGKIKVELGYSPIILTFDDGNENNFKVIEKKENGELVFDPNSAIGILETIKKKYPDFNVTATFFLNQGLCNQPKYNEDIMKWLIENGYDIGNHTTTHADFTKISNDKTKEVVGKMYQNLEAVIPGKYVNIVALPFGSPYSKTHSNYALILNGEYEGITYETKAALRVGWEAEVSPFDSNFDKTFLKRCRAYDNNGVDFDITMNFKLLEKNRYISDGEESIIVIPKSKEGKINETNLKVLTYEEEA